jgi:uncharacterized membrane protein
MKKNTGDMERALSILGGAILLGYSVLRRSKFRIPLGLFGAAALYRGVSGHCPFYSQLNINRAPDGNQNLTQGVVVRRSIIVDAPVEEVYRYWRQLENLPSFIQHLQSVQPLTETRSHWTARVDTLVDPIQWEAEILFERENALIAWRSLPGFQVDNQTVVEFKPDPEQKRTVVRFQMSYAPPTSKTITRVDANLYRHLLGSSPEDEIQEDLLRFQAMVERTSS